MKVNTVSLQLPYPSISVKKYIIKTITAIGSWVVTIRKRKESIEINPIMLDTVGNSNEYGVHASPTANTHFNKVGNNKKKRFSFLKKPSKKLIIYGAVILIFAFVGIRILSSSGGDSDKVQVNDAKAAQEINHEFSFPLRDEDGEVVSDIKYTVEDAELRDEIVIRGQVATSVEGRMFLIVSLKIRNDHNQAIEINTKDYVRLVVDGDEAVQLAPNIHNDPLQIQAISTEPTRLGFTINDVFDSLELRVGEIEGDKESIPLDLN